MNSEKRNFQLEPLEPRILMSAGDNLSELITDSFPAINIEENAPAIQTAFSYNPEAQIDDIFASTEEITAVVTQTQETEPAEEKGEERFISQDIKNNLVQSDNFGDSITEQLVETLCVANGPPASQQTGIFSYAAEVGTNELVLRLNKENLSLLELWDNRLGESLIQSPIEGIHKVLIQGIDEGNDTLTVDFSFPFWLTNGIEYNGGSGWFDTLILKGNSSLNISYNPSGSDSGQINLFESSFREMSIVFTELEPVEISNLSRVTFDTTTNNPVGSENGQDILTVSLSSAVTGEKAWEISGTIGNVSFETVKVYNIDSLVIDTGTNDFLGNPNDVIEVTTPEKPAGLETPVLKTLTIKTGIGDDSLKLFAENLALFSQGKLDTGEGNDTVTIVAGGHSSVWIISDSQEGSSLVIPASIQAETIRLVDVSGQPLSANPNNKYTFKVTSAAALANFSNTSNYRWKIMEATKGIEGFAADAVTINPAGFQNASGSGAFSLELSDDKRVLYVLFSNPSMAIPPETAVLINSLADALLNTHQQLQYQQNTHLHILSQLIPGTNMSVDNLAGVSYYLFIGQYIKNYFESNAEPTFDGLMGYLQDNWGDMLTDSGFTAVVSAFVWDVKNQRARMNIVTRNAYTIDAGIKLPQEAINLGLKLKGPSDFPVEVTSDVEFNFVIDWSNPGNKTFNFNIEKFDFNAVAQNDDKVFKAIFGPLETSIGSSVLGEQKASVNLNLTGSVLLQDGQLKFTHSRSNIDVKLPLYVTLEGHPIRAGPKEIPAIIFKGALFNSGEQTGTLAVSTENFSALSDFSCLNISSFYQIPSDLSNWAKGMQNLNPNPLDVEIPLINKYLSELFNFSAIFNENVAGKIGFKNSDNKYLGTIQEFIAKINSSSLLPKGKNIVYDPQTNVLEVPLEFTTALQDWDNVPLIFDIGTSVSEIKTAATASIHLTASGSLKLLIDFDGLTGSDGLSFFVSNLVFDGTAEFSVNTPDIEARLGFVRFSSKSPGSCVILNAALNLFLDGKLFNLKDALAASNVHSNYNGAFHILFQGIKPLDFPGLSVKQGFDAFEVKLDDIKNPQEMQTFSLPQFSIDPSKISFEDILAGLKQSFTSLADNFKPQPFYSYSLPSVSNSIEGILGFIDVIEQKITILSLHPVAALQDVPAAIQDALGISPDDLVMSLSGSTLSMLVNWESALNKNFDFKLNLADLWPQIPAQYSVLADTLNAEGALAVTASAGLSIQMDILIPGQDSDSLAVFVYPYNQITGTGTQLNAGIKITGDNLSLLFNLGTLKIGVSGGIVNLDADGNSTGQARLTVGYSGGNAPVIQFKSKVSINLPLSIEFLGQELSSRTLIITGGFANPAVPFEFDSQVIQGVVDTIQGIMEDINGLGGENPLLRLLSDPTTIYEGIDFVLSNVEDIFSSGFSKDIPLLGDKLGKAATFIRDLRENLFNELRQKLSAAGSRTIEVIRGLLWNELGTQGFNFILDNNGDGQKTIDDISVCWVDKNSNVLGVWASDTDIPSEIGGVSVDAIEFFLPLGGEIFSTGFDLPLDFSLPGLNLSVNGGFQLEMTWSYDFGFGISVTDGLYLTTNTDANKKELNVQISAYLDKTPQDPLIYEPFYAEGKLLFFKVTATDQDTDSLLPGMQPSGISGAFTLDIIGDSVSHRLTISRLFSSGVFDANFGVTAALNLGLVLEVEGAKGMPKLENDFVLKWDWNMDQGTTYQKTDFNNLSLDLGTFVSDFLNPIVTKIKNTLEPIRPFVETFSKEIDGLAEILSEGYSPNLMGLIDLIMDLRGEDRVDWTFVTAAQYLLDLADSINISTEGVEILLGNISDFGKTNTTSGLPVNLDDFPALKDGLDGIKNGSSGVEYGGTAQSRKGFEVWSHIMDINNWLKVLSGGDAILFIYEMPIFSFNINFNLTLIRIPFWGFTFDINVVGHFGASADLVFGYDTYGIQKALQTGNGSDIFDGFYVNDRDTDKPGNLIYEFQIDASFGLEFSLNVCIAEGGVGGEFIYTAKIDLADVDDDGKVRASEIATMWDFESGGLSNLFNIDSKLRFEAYIFAKWKLPKVEKKWVIMDKTFWEDHHTAQEIHPQLASLENGILTLNSGHYAGNRQYLDTNDGNEIFKVSGSQDVIMVTYNDKWPQSFGDSVTRVSKVVAYGGNGDDTFDASALDGVPVEFHGGVGNDVLIAGNAGGTLYGDEGNDTLTGGVGVDYLYGGLGEDKLSGNAGNDYLYGGVGVDKLFGEEGNDTFVFDDNCDNDRLFDSAGANILDLKDVDAPIEVVINQYKTSFKMNSGASSLPRASVGKIILGPQNDDVFISSFTPQPLIVRDSGGNDVYQFLLGRNTNAGGTIQIDDQSGTFDEIIAEQSKETVPVELGTYSIKSGFDTVNFNSSIERETIIGRAGLFQAASIEDFGGLVTLQALTGGSSTVNLGQSGLRVIASQLNLESAITASHIILDVKNSLNISQQLEVGGYVEIHTYGSGSSITISEDILGGPGGWARLTAQEGSIISTNASIIGATELILVARQAIGTQANPILTNAMFLTAAAGSSAGDIFIKQDSAWLHIAATQGQAQYESDGFTIRGLSAVPGWMVSSRLLGNGVSQLEGVVVGNGNIELKIAGAGGGIDTSLLAGGKIINRGSGNITLIADEINLESGGDTVIGSGELTIRAYSNPWEYRLGTAAQNSYGNPVDLPGSLDLSASDIRAIADGFQHIIIGVQNAVIINPDLMYLGKTEFSDEVYFYAGEITVQADGAGINAPRIHIEAATQLLILGYVKAQESVVITAGRDVDVLSIRVGINGIIETLDNGSVIDINAQKNILISGLIQSEGQDSLIKIFSSEGEVQLSGAILAQGTNSHIAINAGNAVIIEGIIVTGHAPDNGNGRITINSVGNVFIYGSLNANGQGGTTTINSRGDCLIGTEVITASIQAAGAIALNAKNITLSLTSDLRTFGIDSTIVLGAQEEIKISGLVLTEGLNSTITFEAGTGFLLDVGSRIECVQAESSLTVDTVKWLDIYGEISAQGRDSTLDMDAQEDNAVILGRITVNGGINIRAGRDLLIIGDIHSEQGNLNLSAVGNVLVGSAKEIPEDPYTPDPGRIGSWYYTLDVDVDQIGWFEPVSGTEWKTASNGKAHLVKRANGDFSMPKDNALMERLFEVRYKQGSGEVHTMLCGRWRVLVNKQQAAGLAVETFPAPEPFNGNGYIYITKTDYNIFKDSGITLQIMEYVPQWSELTTWEYVHIKDFLGVNEYKGTPFYLKIQKGALEDIRQTLAQFSEKLTEEVVGDTWLTAQAKLHQIGWWWPGWKDELGRDALADDPQNIKPGYLWNPANNWNLPQETPLKVGDFADSRQAVTEGSVFDYYHSGLFQKGVQQPGSEWVPWYGLEYLQQKEERNVLIAEAPGPREYQYVDEPIWQAQGLNYATISLDANNQNIYGSGGGVDTEVPYYYQTVIDENGNPVRRRVYVTNEMIKDEFLLNQNLMDINRADTAQSPRYGYYQDSAMNDTIPLDAQVNVDEYYNTTWDPQQESTPWDQVVTDYHWQYQGSIEGKELVPDENWDWRRNEGKFSAPYRIATDSQGNVYVVDRVTFSFLGRIQKFTSQGEFISSWYLFPPTENYDWGYLLTKIEVDS